MAGTERPLNLPYLLAAFASLLCLGFVDNARPALITSIFEDLKIGDAIGSWLFGASSAGIIAGTRFSRALGRRFSSLRLLQLGQLIVAGSFFAMGRCDGAGTLIAASFVFGIGAGFLAPAQNLMVQQAAPPERRRQAFSALHASYGLASLLAPLAVVLLARFGLDWRTGFTILAVIPLVLVAADLLVRPLPVRPAPPPAGPGDRGWHTVFALMLGLAVCAELAISTRLPALLEQEGRDPETAKLWLTAFFACLLASRLAGGVVRLPIGTRATLAVSGVGALAVTVAGLLWLPELLAFVALPLGIFFPSGMELLAEERPERIETAMNDAFAWISGLLVGCHALIGWLSDLHGRRVALSVGAIALLGALALLAVLPRVGTSGWAGVAVSRSGSRGK